MTGAALASSVRAPTGPGDSASGRFQEKKLGWLSDIHLNFLSESEVRRFFGQLAASDVDGWLVSGDIGEVRSVAGYLRLFATELPCRTYFVLGNHDCYGGSLAGVRAEMERLSRQSDRLVWLTASDPQAPGDCVAIVGDDGWGDGRFGNARRTPVELNDFLLIDELAGLTRQALVRTLNTWGDQAAARLVPWFACQATGEAILACAKDSPRTDFLVLCGHTHGGGVHAPAPNVVVHTAAAEYGTPEVQRSFEFETRAEP